MPTTTEDFQLVISTAQVEKLDALDAKLERATGSFDRLRDAQGRFVGAGGSASAASDVYELADAYEVLGNEVTSVFTSAASVPRAFDFSTINTAARKQVVQFGDAVVDVGEKVTSSGRKIERGMKGSAQSILSFSRGVQDFAQGGVGGVLNNVEGMLLPFGAKIAALAGPATLLATAGYLVYQNWGSVLKVFGAGREIPKAAGDLDGLKESLKGVKDEIDALNKQGYLSTGQFNRLESLRKTEADLKQQVEARTTVDRLGKLKSQQEQEVVQAFESALKESGADKQLKALEADFKASPNPAIRKAFTTVINALEKGNVEAYDALVDMLEGKFGKDDKLASELKKLRPNTNRPDLDPFEERAREVRQANAEAADRLSKQLSEQGVRLEGEMLGDLADQARKGIADGLAKKLQEVLIRTRAEGSKGAKEFTYTTQAIVDELERLFPELKAFPAKLASVAKELARGVMQATDKAIDDLRQQEGLTRQEALRRLNQQQAEKQQGKGEALAEDEFTQLAARNARNAGNKGYTPEQAREEGRRMRAQLAQAGLSTRQQIQVGRAFNDPRTVGVANEALGALANRGLDRNQSLQALPRVLDNLNRGAGGVEQAVQMLQNQVIRNQAMLANRVANLGQNAKRSLQSAQQVGRFLQENQPSALNFGGF